MSEPTTSPETASPATEHVSVHRWPWRAQEFVSMAIAFTLTLGFGYAIASVRSDQLGTIWLTGTVIAAFGVVYWLYRVKQSRTLTSQVIVTVTGTRIKVASDGPLGKSAVDSAKVTNVGYRKYMSDEAFMLSDGTQTAKVPLRATSDPVVRGIVEQAVAAADTVSPEARDLYDLMGETLD